MSIFNPNFQVECVSIDLVISHVSILHVQFHSKETKRMVSVSNSVRPDLTVKIDQFLLSNTRPSVSLMIHNSESKRMSHTKWVTKCFKLCQRASRREKIWFVWWLWHKMATNIQIQDFSFYMERITPQSRSLSGKIPKAFSKIFFFEIFIQNDRPY